MVPVSLHQAFLWVFPFSTLHSDTALEVRPLYLASMRTPSCIIGLSPGDPPLAYLWVPLTTAHAVQSPCLTTLRTIWPEQTLPRWYPLAFVQLSPGVCPVGPICPFGFLFHLCFHLPCFRRMDSAHLYCILFCNYLHCSLLLLNYFYYCQNILIIIHIINLSIHSRYFDILKNKNILFQ